MALRSFWRADEIGYYTYKPVAGQPGRDCRQLLGSWRGGVFLLSTVAGVDPRVDWGGGDPTEIIVKHSANAQLAMAALKSANAAGLQPVPRGLFCGFNLKSVNGKSSYGLVVVPYWVPFLLLSLPGIMALRRRRILQQRRKHGLCLYCGYDLRASGPICSECGLPRAPSRDELRAELKTPIIVLPLQPGRRWLIPVGGVALAAVVAWCWAICHRVGLAEPAVRLDSGTVLSADHLPQRVELDLGKGVTMRLALIPAGHFLMGSPEAEAGRCNDEGPQHEVTISKPFYMGQTTVTQEQYEAAMGSNPSENKGAKNPVEMVSWDDAVKFCQKVSAQTGRRVQLPTEAQWEYACRAGSKMAYNTGRTLPRDMANYGVCWTYPSNRAGNPEETSFPAGSFPSNAWGLYDMHGNVWQWCSDWYRDYKDGPVTDTAGVVTGGLRVLRGGSWFDGPGFCRSAYRRGSDPGGRSDDDGFRVAVLAAGVDLP